ncbi:hypothetical protein BDF14DRAFT_1752628 [Spinellus fusiger]|nr:hypothetical protein BDF14DRAFT_1752628 [Spinellus fusiger]
MSAQLARKSLQLLLKPTPAPSAEKNTAKTRHTETRVPRALPKTKTGLKKIKYELRYGQHQRTKQRQEQEKKRAHPIVALVKDEKALDDNLARNVRVLTSKLRASRVERQLHKALHSKGHSLRSGTAPALGEDSD